MQALFSNTAISQVASRGWQGTTSGNGHDLRQPHMTHYALAVALLALFMLFTTTGTAEAAAQQPVDGIARWTVNGGGSVASGNGYQLMGTMGQTDADAESLMGNGYGVRSGFWWPGDNRLRSADDYPLHIFLPVLQH